jgi:hypothetical protein
MKAYVIRPTMDVFDGTGTLGADASRAVHFIAEMVADSLRAGGDDSHRAAVWEGVTETDTPPLLIDLPDRKSFIALARKMLDPNGLLGGDIRSASNCRAATFGQDGQARLCLRHEDAAPVSSDPSLATVTDHSELLVASDLFDGSWPSVC